VTHFDNLETLDIHIDDMTAHVTLNRPNARNAMNQQMVKELTAVFQQFKGNQDIRAVLLSGAEGTFCSGGDIKEMRESDMPDARNASNLDAMLQAVNTAYQVVIARVEGAALGGGLGLVCVSDIAISSTDTQFGLPEVRLGVAPAFISPYVLQRVGLTRTRELMLTGRRFQGEKAKAYGIVHEVCPPDELQDCIDLVLDDVRQCAPGAIAATKELIFKVNDRSPDQTVSYRASLLNRLRAGDEAQEGMLAFIEKRPAKWVSGE
jgi:isohexenylglutaconyl-CoA hydratase